MTHNARAPAMWMPLAPSAAVTATAIRVMVAASVNCSGEEMTIAAAVQTATQVRMWQRNMFDQCITGSYLSSHSKRG